jgi:hypothetical protein
MPGGDHRRQRFASLLSGQMRLGRPPATGPAQPRRSTVAWSTFGAAHVHSPAGLGPGDLGEPVVQEPGQRRSRDEGGGHGRVHRRRIRCDLHQLTRDRSPEHDHRTEVSTLTGHALAPQSARRSARGPSPLTLRVSAKCIDSNGRPSKNYREPRPRDSLGRAVLAEQHDRWIESLRCAGLKILIKTHITPDPDSDPDTTPEQVLISGTSPLSARRAYAGVSDKTSGGLTLQLLQTARSTR